MQKFIYSVCVKGGEIEYNMVENDFKIEKEWKSNGNTLYLESTKGKYKFSSRPEFTDKLFTIRINNGERFAFKHEQQIDLIKAVLENDILPYRFIQNCEKFLHSIYEIKGKRRKLEMEKYNVNLMDYLQKDLWGCMNKNGST
jgi:hypothetical protein